MVYQLATILLAAIVAFLLWFLRRLAKSSASARTALIERAIRAERQRDLAVEEAHASAGRDSARLAALLNELHEGVVVCNLQDEIVLYNRVALKLLRVCGEIGLGRQWKGCSPRSSAWSGIRSTPKPSALSTPSRRHSRRN